MIVAQGIEIDWLGRRDADGVYPAAIRCEYRIHHWCGNDPVAASFHQTSLNRTLILAGYGTLHRSEAAAAPPPLDTQLPIDSTRSDVLFPPGLDRTRFTKWGVDVGDAHRLSQVEGEP
jgi:hypothetical protein